MDDKIEIIWRDLNGCKKSKWINYAEWLNEKNFRHKKEMYLSVFGCRAFGSTDTPITKEENEMFNKWYEEIYPDRCNLKCE